MIKRASKLPSRQFILYTFIGLSGVGLDFILFFVLHKLLHIDPIVANIISTTAGIANNFILNSVFNFKKRDVLFLRFISFFGVGVIGIIISSIIIRILHDSLGVDPLLAKFASLFVVLVSQYQLNKLISFRTLPTSMTTGKLGRILIPYVPDALLVLLLATSFALAAAYLPSTDETANLLESKMILGGNLPYRDFFTHHMPGIYLISIPVYLLSLDNVYLFRVISDCIIFTWIATNVLVMRQTLGEVSSRIYTALLIVGSMVFWMHLGLAEPIITCALTSAFLLLLKTAKKTSRPSLRMVAGISFLLSFIAFLGIAYSFAVAAGYLVLVYYIFREIPRRNQWRQVFLYALLCILPALLLITCLALSGMLNEFLFDNLTFNSTYYSSFFKPIGTTPLDVLINTTLISFSAISELFRSMNLSAIIIFAGYLGAALTLYISGYRILSIFILSLIFLLNPRGDAFGAHAISAPLADITQHSTPYRVTGLLMLSILPGLIAQRFLLTGLRHNNTYLLLKRSWPWPYTSGVIVLILLLSQQSFNLLNETYKETSSVNLFRRERSLPYPYGKTVDSLLPPESSAWIGPYDFESQVRLKAPAHIRYTFYAPWHAACLRCTDDFLIDLKTQRPAIIYWEERFTIAGQSAEKYAPRISQQLSEDYFTIADKRLDNFYFLRSKANIMRQILINKGYEIE